VRNGVARQVFGRHMTIDLRDGFPLLTTKKMSFDMALEEFLWDLHGHQNINKLGPKTRKFWEAWADDNGDLPTSYGRAWRRYPTPSEDVLADHEREHHWHSGDTDEVDQIGHIFRELRHNPTNRRLVLSTWMPSSGWLEPIPACHPTIIFSSNGTQLDMLVVARSNDMCLGFPWDVARYALLQHTAAARGNLGVRHLAFSWANAHIYEPHWKTVEKQLQRPVHPLPRLLINARTETAEDYALEGYTHEPFLKYEFLE
jgi:thymidylate synthase